MRVTGGPAERFVRVFDAAVAADDDDEIARLLARSRQ